jgi:beta-galactosidase
MFFQWRASRFGAEKYHSAMVPHAGTDSKVWREVVELGQILERMGEVAGTTLTAEVALVFDWQSQWALETGSHPSVDVRYLDQVYALYRAFWDAGVTVDMVSPDADLGGYRLVVLPSLYIASETTATNIERFVQAGGNAVVTYMSGVVDENLHLFEGAFPGAYREVLGVKVEEFFPLRASEKVKLDDGSHADVFTELIHLEGATALARFVDGPLPGSPAVTVHEHGAGSSWYIGSRLEQEAVNRLIRDVLKTLKLKPPIPMVTAPAGLEVTRRAGPDRSYLFVINHGSETAHLRANGWDLVADRQLTGTLSLQGGTVAVVREEMN